LGIGLIRLCYQFQITPFDRLDRAAVIPNLSSEELTGAGAYDPSRFPAAENTYKVAYLKHSINLLRALPSCLVCQTHPGLE
jgi:hypothetical protein